MGLQRVGHDWATEQRDSDVENRYADTEREEEGGTWGVRSDIRRPPAERQVAAVQRRGLSSVPCDLERWEAGREGGGFKRAGICTHVADSLCGTAEINTTL